MYKTTTVRGVPDYQDKKKKRKIFWVKAQFFLVTITLSSKTYGNPKSIEPN